MFWKMREFRCPAFKGFTGQNPNPGAFFIHPLHLIKAHICSNDFFMQFPGRIAP